MAITKELHDLIVNWLEDNLIPRESINNTYDTSHIRAAFAYAHKYNRDLYFDNDTLNTIMLELGYRTANFAGAPYLHFNVSSKSPALRIHREAFSHS